MEVKKLMDELAMRHPGESEYLQAVHEVLLSIEEVYNSHPEFEANRIVFSHSKCLGWTTGVRCM